MTRRNAPGVSIRRTCVAIAAVAMLVAVDAGASALEASETRLERVVLLTAGNRVSLVFELSAEPRDVSTRRVSGAVLELEAGPVRVTAAESFAAPAGVRFVSSVTVQPGSGGAHLLKARITLGERSRSTVRIAGRRVYIDIAEDAPPPPRQPERIVPQSPAASPPAPEPEAVPAVNIYQTAVGPLIERLDQLAPFLLSATAAPDAPVLEALGETLSSLEQSVETIDVPAESRDVHRMLSSAIALAMDAVQPEFAGDRVAQTRRALALLQQVRALWS